jgi:hypothetical protein
MPVFKRIARKGKLLPGVILIFLCVNLHAEKRLFLGVEEGLTYDTNIFLSKYEQDDFIMTTNPHTAIKLSGKRHSLEFYYGFIYFDFFNYSSLDYYSHILKTIAELKVFQGLELGVNYEYRIVPLELGLPVSSPENLVNQSYLKTSAKYKKEFSPRTTFDAGVEWLLVNYPGNKINSDYWELRFPFTLTQNLDRLMSAGFGYTFLVRSFKADEFIDYNLHHLTLDGNFKLRKLTLSTSLGYEWLDYKGVGVNSGPLILFDIKYDITKRTEVKSGYNYEYSSDARGTPYRGQHGEVFLTHRFTERVDFAPFFNLYLYKMPGVNYKIRTLEGGASMNLKSSRFINFSLDYLYSYNERTNLIYGTKDIFDVHRAGLVVKIII